MQKQRTLLVANWKMAPTRLRDAAKILRDLEPAAKQSAGVDIWVAPPALFLAPLQNEFGHSFTFGLQDASAEREGGFTGEISSLMAKDMGAAFTILGHSERKRLGETTALTNRKVKAALAAGLKVILCFGESNRPRELSAKHMAPTWQAELKQLLRNISSLSYKLKAKSSLFLAFEPAWAISTHSSLRSSGQALRKVYPERMRGAPPAYLEDFLAWYRKHYRFPVLYGGSVDGTIIKTYHDLRFDGYLIGAASRKPKEFSKIIKTIAN